MRHTAHPHPNISDDTVLYYQVYQVNNTILKLLAKADKSPHNVQCCHYSSSVYHQNMQLKFIKPYQKICNAMVINVCAI